MIWSPTTMLERVSRCQYISADRRAEQSEIVRESEDRESENIRAYICSPPAGDPKLLALGPHLSRGYPTRLAWSCTSHAVTCRDISWYVKICQYSWSKNVKDDMYHQNWGANISMPKICINMHKLAHLVLCLWFMMPDPAPHMTSHDSTVRLERWWHRMTPLGPHPPRHTSCTELAGTKQGPCSLTLCASLCSDHLWSILIHDQGDTGPNQSQHISNCINIYDQASNSEDIWRHHKTSYINMIEQTYLNCPPTNLIEFGGVDLSFFLVRSLTPDGSGGDTRTYQNISELMDLMGI